MSETLLDNLLARIKVSLKKNNYLKKDFSLSSAEILFILFY
ncbi:hypothetical protein SMU104_04517 [Streptococcus mutans SA41]|nr:hypothetical protein SMU104_04517 [Streptococcus mutans SA41]